MSAPLPSPYDQLTGKPFSFYPAVVGVEHNEWLLKHATWSEFLVANTKSGGEFWISRRFVGELSKTDEPVMIVGLVRELELRAGQFVPHVRRVLEMPAAGAAPRPEDDTSAPVLVPKLTRGLDSGTESRVGKLILTFLVLGVLGCVAIVALLQEGGKDQVRFKPVMQSDLGLSGQDDYHAVVRKLGQPAEDRWRSDQGEMQYRILTYPDRSLSVILMGADRPKALYIGAVDTKGKPVHAVPLTGGKDTYPLLRSLRFF